MKYACISCFFYYIQKTYIQKTYIQNFEYFVVANVKNKGLKKMFGRDKD